MTPKKKLLPAPPRERSKDGKWVQCMVVWTSGRTITFCRKHEGHSGDHRGIGVQWNATGKVPITEKGSS